MLRSRQRTIWLICIATLWIVGVYVVYQKATNANLLDTWPAKHSHNSDKTVLKLLSHLDELEQSEAGNVATYQDLNKKFIYYIDKRFRSKVKDELSKAGEEMVHGDSDKIEEGVEEDKKHSYIPGPNDGPPGSGIRIPVLVFACNRKSVSVCLDNLLKHRPNAHQFPIIVSQVRRANYD